MLQCSVAFVHISRCLLRARRPLQQYSRSFLTAHPSYATVAIQSPSWTVQSMPLDLAKAHETYQTNHLAPASETAKSVETTIIGYTESLPPTVPAVQPRKSNDHQVSLLRNNEAIPLNSRVARKKPRVLRARSLKKYLDSSRPRRISLGSWNNVSRTTGENCGHRVVHPDVDEIDTNWSIRLRCLEEGRRLEEWRTTNIERFLIKYAGPHLSRKVLHKLWVHLPVHHRLGRWQDAMLWCMQHSPKRALLLLLVTSKGRAFRPPRYMIQDCLQLLARHFLFEVSKADPLVLNAIWRLTLRSIPAVLPEDVRSYPVSQDVIQLLLKHCDDTQALSIYEKLVSNQVYFSANTMLHFLERLVEMGKLDLSMSLLAKVTSSCASDVLSSNQIQSACVKLLRTHWVIRGSYHIQSRIVSQILEMGIRPNTQLYNVILLTMIDGHDFDTAWQTYDIIKQSNHFKGDSVTYGILAKGARLSGNSNILDKVIQDVDQNPDLQDLRLDSDILCAIGSLSPSYEFPIMLDFYKKRFDLRPLKDLGFCGLKVEGSCCPKGNGQWPTVYILGQMMLAYNKCHNHSAEELVQRYNRYHELVQQKHPLVAPLARNDYVANSFLLAFSRRLETLEHCTSVLKHMLSPPTSPDSAPYAAPTVRTWSILVAAYIFHKQKFAAEKVLTMMRERGLQPDIVTWNTLVRGYSDMQDVDGAVGALRRMEAAGFESDSRTLKGLGRLWDRGKLLDMLKSSMDKPVASDPRPSSTTKPGEPIPSSLDPERLMLTDGGEKLVERSKADLEKDGLAEAGRNAEVDRYLDAYSQRYK